jgi:hypothetical protein
MTTSPSIDRDHRSGSLGTLRSRRSWDRKVPSGGRAPVRVSVADRSGPQGSQRQSRSRDRQTAWLTRASGALDSLPNNLRAEFENWCGAIHREMTCADKEMPTDAAGSPPQRRVVVAFPRLYPAHAFCWMTPRTRDRSSGLSGEADRGDDESAAAESAARAIADDGAERCANDILREHADACAAARGHEMYVQIFASTTALEAVGPGFGAVGAAGTPAIGFAAWDRKVLTQSMRPRPSGSYRASNIKLVRDRRVRRGGVVYDLLSSRDRPSGLSGEADRRCPSRDG